jgi:hypothetical protein
MYRRVFHRGHGGAAEEGSEEEGEEEGKEHLQVGGQVRVLL